MAYYKQEEEREEDLMKCPYCNTPVLISEYQEAYLCPKCYEEGTTNSL